MDSLEAEDRSQRLLGNVARAHELLNRCGESWWARWIAVVQRELTAHDAHGLERLLNGYGGMGGFHDLVIHPMNGHSVAADDVDAVNNELVRLSAEMHGDARALLGALRRER
ncbi:hypothetical protein [Rhodococcus sp. X156]|uniref:DUF6966 domain-containing protein n=1 Tax=Rhodococcus sp. X156 TaxID=2499145 RepID=UPI000FD80D27|nr:hypothetical protein [Rhodococcus sp. X156]